MSVSPVGPRSAAIPQSTGNAYTVQRGDTLSGIAASHGVSLAALEAANPQITNPNLIYPGQQIAIPGGGQGSSPAPGGISGTAPTGAAPSGLQGRENEAMGYFMGQGWSRAQAAGIVSNLEYESAHTLDPHLQQFGGGPGYGIAQWEGPRQAVFRQVFGHDIHSASYGEELQFVQWELTHTERGAGNALRATSNAYDAGMSVMNNYERPADRNQPWRGRLAQQIYDRASPGGGSVPAPPPQPTPPSQPPGGGTYTVRSGDSLSGIASSHGVSLSALEAANPQISNPNLIHPGEQIHIPGGGGSAPRPAPAGTYTVRSGDSMSGIAARHGVLLSALEAANPQIGNPNLIYPGERIHMPGGGHASPAPAAHDYTVRGGDTLSGIASRNGVSLAALEAANRQIGNPNVIHPGEVVHIPGR